MALLLSFPNSSPRPQPPRASPRQPSRMRPLWVRRPLPSAPCMTRTAVGGWLLGGAGAPCSQGCVVFMAGAATVQRKTGRTSLLDERRVATATHLLGSWWGASWHPHSIDDEVETQKGAEMGQRCAQDQCPLISTCHFHLATPPPSQTRRCPSPASRLPEKGRDSGEAAGERALRPGQQEAPAPAGGEPRTRTLPAFPVAPFRGRAWPPSLGLGTDKIGFESYSSVH